MSPEKSWQLRISHIIQAIGKIQRYVAGHTPDSFASDEKTIDAVLRNFQVLGEAARHVPPEV